MTIITWQLLERFLSDDCAEGERDLVERWLGEKPSRLEAAVALSNATMFPNDSANDVWAALRRRLISINRPLDHPGQDRLRIVKAMAFAAIAVGALLAVRHAIRGATRSSPPPSIRVARTPAGQRASFHLSDGTRVMLAAASTLRSPVEFGTGPREVELSGEAYFEVAPDSGRPFVVRAADIIARDLGTSFLVRAYPDEGHARIVVREGRVAMGAAAHPNNAGMSMIAPGQSGRFLPDGSPVVEEADTAAYFSWTEGRLTLDNIPLRDALPQLSRWYDLDFHLADSALGDVPISATLASRLSPDLLNLLARSLGMRQVRNGRTVTFYPASGIH
jgi:transmembrane sensor